MIGLLQRVAQASVSVDGELIGRIGRGLLVLVAVHRDDTEPISSGSPTGFLATGCFPTPTIA